MSYIKPAIKFWHLPTVDPKYGSGFSSNQHMKGNKIICIIPSKINMGQSEHVQRQLSGFWKYSVSRSGLWVHSCAVCENS